MAKGSFRNSRILQGFFGLKRPNIRLNLRTGCSWTTLQTKTRYLVKILVGRSHTLTAPNRNKRNLQKRMAESPLFGAKGGWSFIIGKGFTR